MGVVALKSVPAGMASEIKTRLAFAPSKLIWVAVKSAATNPVGGVARVLYPQRQIACQRIVRQIVGRAVAVLSRDRRQNAYKSLLSRADRNRWTGCHRFTGAVCRSASRFARCAVCIIYCVKVISVHAARTILVLALAVGVLPSATVVLCPAVAAASAIRGTRTVTVPMVPVPGFGAIEPPVPTPNVAVVAPPAGTFTAVVSSTPSTFTIWIVPWLS